MPHAAVPAAAPLAARRARLATLAVTATQARRLAASIGYPVRLAVVSPDIDSAAESGGILEGVSCADEVGRGFDTVVVNAYRFKPDARVVGVSVMPMR